MIPFHFHIETPFFLKKKQPLLLKISERLALLYVFANLRDTDLVKKKKGKKKKPHTHPKNNQLDSLFCFCTREMPSSTYKKWQ